MTALIEPNQTLTLEQIQRLFDVAGMEVQFNPSSDMFQYKGDAFAETYQSTSYFNHVWNKLVHKLLFEKGLTRSELQVLLYGQESVDCETENTEETTNGGQSESTDDDGKAIETGN